MREKLVYRIDIMVEHGMRINSIQFKDREKAVEEMNKTVELLRAARTASGDTRDDWVNLPYPFTACVRRDRVMAVVIYELTDWDDIGEAAQAAE